MADAHVTVGQIRGRVAKFVEDRRWEKYHKPKDLAMALSVEAAELLERFLWRDSLPSHRLSAEDRVGVAEELADVLIYGMSLANVLHIDVSDAVFAKLAKDEAKYPVDRFKGRASAGADPP